MNKKIIMISIIFLIVGWLYIQYFHLGFLVDVNKISYELVGVDDKGITLNFFTIDSSQTYSRHKLRDDGQKVYIKIYTALPSKFRRNKNIIKINLDMARVKEIFIEDNLNQVNVTKL